MVKVWNKLNTAVCPWWLNPTFDNPIRRLVHDPVKILSPYVQTGMTVADVGCGMGYFTLPLAELVGEDGLVFAVDIQPRSLEMLKRRAERANLAKNIRTIQAGINSLSLERKVDFLLTNWMVHETPDPSIFLRQATDLIKQGGLYLLVEPIGHVGEKAFDAEVEIILSLGLKPIERPKIFFSRAIVFRKE